MKCFITKLKGNVTDGSLPKLEELRFLIKKTGDVRNIILCDGVASNKKVTSTVSGNNYFTDYNGTVNNGNSLIYGVTQDQNRYFNSLEDGYYIVSPKYNIGRIQIKDYKDMDIDISDLSYCKNLTAIKIYDTSLFGDIASLNRLVNLTSINISRTNVSGDIASLNSLVNLNDINVSGTGIYGDCKNLFDGLVTAGKMNGTLKIWTAKQEVSYNGEKPTKRVWTATFNNGSYSVENTNN